MEYYRKALHLDPALVSAYYNMGSVFQEKGRFEEAIIYYRKALQLNPEFGDAWNSMGVILQGQGMLDESIMHYQKALEIDPNFADAYYNIGKALQQKGCLNEAVVNYQKALQLNPDSAEVHNNIGFCFHEKGQNDEALSHFQKAIDLNPEFAEAYYNLALNYHDKKMIKKAIEYYEKAIECKNDFVRAHWNMSCALLLSGDFERGWKEYEWRWKLKEHRGYRTTHTRWDGSDIAGQTILLHAEQGFGDTIQFIRYAPLVAQRGARVIVQCPKELLPLIRKVKGIEQVLSKEGQMPKFDLQCPLLSLPLLFGTTLENIPCEIPYISADLSLFRNWRALLRSDSSMLKVGLVWSGRTKGKREHRRSCPLSFFSAFTQFDNIMFYSLQKGDGSEEAKMPPKGMRLIDCQEDLHDFSDTAALIANLDLIVSVDTAVAHLAGSLGKPVWTMLPFIPDWRWLLNRDDSPWYPTMRLFRQPSPGDWQSVIGHMEKALIEYVNR
ncbi:MAG: tetratricopeptide repeat-containing glycosyltransferase family protein [Thermodesulfovibrionales bacterium]|nr:tetratricopeptide repeat-containing glycosyltransferase family protein [Thermodesulfovibrionales bacterium]